MKYSLLLPQSLSFLVQINTAQVFKRLFPALKVPEELTETSDISPDSDLSMVAFLFGIFFPVACFPLFSGGGWAKGGGRQYKANFGKIFNFTL